MEAASRTIQRGSDGVESVIGLVNRVLTQSFVDGPGNRAVVFLQGCNFHCLYCHNPYMITLCNHCGDCVAQCPQGALRLEDGQVIWDSTACVECDQCIEICPSSSSPQVRRLTPRALWLAIEPYVPFLSGVTMSGGEATLQAPFVRNFFAEVKARSDLTTLIQTNGDVSPKDLEDLLPVTDGFMVDLKAFDSTAHHKLTGQANIRVMGTIRFLSERHKLFQVRQVVVPNVNDSESQATEMAAFLMTVDSEIHLAFLRFRPHGARGIAATWESPNDDKMESMVAAAQETGLKHVDHSI